MKHLRTPALIALALLASACGGGTSTNGAPVIAAFTAEPATVSPGGESTLTWIVEGDVTLLEITVKDGDFYSPIDVTDDASYAARPTETTTYILRARNAAGTDQEEEVVGVEPVETME